MKYIVLVLILIVGGLLLSSRFKTQEKKVAPLTVEVSPQDPSFSSQLWKFGVSLDTHSGDLNQDLVKIATLRDDKGKVYRPISWEGDPPGGHHRKGTLSFQSVNPKPAQIILQIEERKFIWDIK
ncbi:MAG: hypothetical protein UX99_C0018G0010 [Candidatus Amesbacteria bacterium GW2011_GWB1_47_26]|uniref:Uncharacterized protein n=1 Tax=Candidatus Amesbacteria bacterium GW2011_GWC2_45_19 TaxID=1618366 RepID=A0A0G1M5K7_9BACT|nr:MAG: hypothetical protein UX05_C0001G0041 [Candidatus Amesbacteria bacterium GW2011_GWC2_45_19]KKU38573.1 MAG: hypothetical protein UX52_C0004G0043 [Candidatus Amesbacteria bacterium GW2011_GWA1_46_35]KKU69606.1 MAG: hypothetical protein UX93_C0001G0191 [Microgenomates group bacterium GW2011_GWC1_47_20]KKU74302.1 MAG: hypothetical protein UX99_C0018G0010 [Candidatus Amesbacteria bacterium GW2011_GWB1_47_26]KKU79607.1 MAG: hypothetical protein UY06_C0017G0016 [Candidatus Amesbacteria bacteriu